MKKRFEIRSSHAIVIYTATMVLTYIACKWAPQLPFAAFGATFTGGFLGILAKRGYNRKLGLANGQNGDAPIAPNGGGQ